MFKKIKMGRFIISGLASTMILSMVQLSAVHAADSCFVTFPYQENIMSDPLHSDVFYVGVASACEMKLYDMDVSFTNIDTIEGLNRMWSDHADELSDVEFSDDGLRLKWSGSKDEQEDIDYVEFDSSDESWDYLFGQWYYIPTSSLNPPTTFKRNLSITINSAHYEVNGEMREVKNLVLDSVATVAPDYDKDTLMISGVEKQDVSYTGQPVALEGELAIEENDDSITAENLTEQYYLYNYYDSSFTPIDRPTNPGEFYLVEYRFENDNYRALQRVPFTIKDYITVSTDIWNGHGEVSAPAYVDKGGNLHVDIIPAEGYEVVWVEYNDNDVTELLNEDNSLVIEGVNEDAEIVAAFRPVYQVTDGDDGEHVRGSGNDLAFMIDKDPSSYTSGEVLIVVDDAPVDLENDSVVEPETGTITLLGDYLDTLTVGRHNVEIYFFDAGFGGIARASFVIVEATTDENSETTKDSELVVPNTGLFTGENSSSMEVTGFVAAVITAIVSALGLVLTRKKIKESK